MKKSKRPNPAKSVESPEEQEEALTQELVELARNIARQNGRALPNEAEQKKKIDFQKIIKKCLQQKNDDALYEALERAQYEDIDAYRFLKDSIEEASGVIVFRRDDDHDLEVNAFIIPLFAHTTGGLHSEQCFQDEDAFDLLRKSFQEARLESRDARVVLVSHAYHLEEIDRISYSQLNEMVRDAFDSMTRKKAAAAPAITRSMSGWPESTFNPEDSAVELRFLLGFALKTLDDPFYKIPEDEAAADRYFEERAVRFRQWTKQVAPLVRRCLVADNTDVDLDFLYQDLFHGGKETGIAEYQMLQMMSDLQHGLADHNIPPENTYAVVGPSEAGDETVLRVNLHAESNGALVASSEKPISLARDLRHEIEDACDALMTIGVKSFSLAMEFDADGQAVDVRPYEN